MLKTILALSLICSLTVNGQQNEEKEIRKIIDHYFEGFNRPDTTLLRSVIAPHTIIQELRHYSKDNHRIRTTVDRIRFDPLLSNIETVSDRVNQEQRMSSCEIRIDGPLANAWVYYDFWQNNSFVNKVLASIQLYHNGTSWKIINVVVSPTADTGQ